MAATFAATTANDATRLLKPMLLMPIPMLPMLTLSRKLLMAILTLLLILSTNTNIHTHMQYNTNTCNSIKDAYQ